MIGSFDGGGPARKLKPKEREHLRLLASNGAYRETLWREILAKQKPPQWLTKRWTPLIPHPEQIRLLRSTARFRVVAAGRRSGKTERALRYLAMRALGPQKVKRARYIFAAPTRDQAKAIAWDALRDLIPKWARARRDSESELTIYLKNGARIFVVGLDRPQRIEGKPIDGIIIDEIAEVRRSAWTSTIRPGLDTIGRPGWCWFIGRPKGRGLFYELVKDYGLPEEVADWDYFHWRSSDLLSAETIAAARRDLDLLSYLQEYEAEFVTFEGRAYYAFARETHASSALRYDPTLPLVLCFDFNVAPGVCSYIQEQTHDLGDGRGSRLISCAIGEAYIPQNSNTPAICRRIIADFGKGGAIAGAEGHKLPIRLYGDASGGARHTQGVLGTDWDLIRNELRPVFGGQLLLSVPTRNPPERARVNAVNTRLSSADGTVRFLVDPKRSPQLANDLEEVTLLEGGSGEIDKDKDKRLTHISDAVGYYIAERWPVDVAPDPKQRAGGSRLR